MAIAQPIEQWRIPGVRPRLSVLSSDPSNDATARRRRLLATMAGVVALVALWVGTGALAPKAHAGSAAPVAPHQVAGAVYVVQAGDSLWSIATRLLPGDNPNSVVAALRSELGGAPLRPGVVLRLP